MIILAYDWKGINDPNFIENTKPSIPEPSNPFQLAEYGKGMYQYILTNKELSHAFEEMIPWYLGSSVEYDTPSCKQEAFNKCWQCNLGFLMSFIPSAGKLGTSLFFITTSFFAHRYFLNN